MKACYAEGQPELDEEAGRGGVRRAVPAAADPDGQGPAGRLRRGRAAAGGPARPARLRRHVADHRPGRLHGPDWDRARWQLVEGGWDAARSAARPDADTYVVVMTHSLSADGRALKGALQSPARYVGLVGPAGRAAKLLAELKEKGVEPAPGVVLRARGPGDRRRDRRKRPRWPSPRR